MRKQISTVWDPVYGVLLQQSKQINAGMLLYFEFQLKIKLEIPKFTYWVSQI